MSEFCQHGSKQFDAHVLAMRQAKTTRRQLWKKYTLVKQFLHERIKTNAIWMAEHQLNEWDEPYEGFNERMAAYYNGQLIHYVKWLKLMPLVAPPSLIANWDGIND